MTIKDFIYRPFGEADETQQAAMFNGLAMALLECCKWSESNAEYQMCHMANHLDKHGELLVTNLAEFVRLRKENS